MSVSTAKMNHFKEVAKKHSIRVTTARQSPMNKLQWLCVLACGHETWHTATRKPKFAYCYICNPVVKP